MTTDYATGSLEQVFDRMELGLLLVGGNRTVCRINAAGRRILAAGEEVVASDLLEVLPEARALFADPAKGSSVELWVTRPEGSKRKVLFDVGDPDRDGSRMVFFRDVTAEWLRRERQGRAEQLAVAEKMASRFCHTARNSLAAVYAGMQTLERSGSVVPDDAFVIGLVLDELRALRGILDEFRDAARAGSNELSGIDLSGLLGRSIAAVDESARARRVSLELAAGPANLCLKGDEAALGRMLRNLLRNAVESCDAGGRVLLGWDVRLAEHAPTDAPTPRRRMTIIFGEDHGKGFPKDLAEVEVLKPFLKRDTGETGLGLAVVQEIVEAHGGTISFSALPAGGTRFEILLPEE
ncbi:MAG: hypothetical protein HY914_15105 [Desulfomonile tiedjei]|nr:hypothetical protein [Desulfomonile tiedjei]